MLWITVGARLLTMMTITAVVPLAPLLSFQQWFIRRNYIVFGAIAVLSRFNETFVDFPRIQKPNTFTADQAIEKMQSTVSGS